MLSLNYIIIEYPKQILKENFQKSLWHLESAQWETFTAFTVMFMFI